MNYKIKLKRGNGKFSVRLRLGVYKGMEWNRMEWNGFSRERNGMEWNGMKFKNLVWML